MDYNALAQMTVQKLRDEAKKHDIAGVASMKKNELVDVLAEKLDLEKPVGKKKMAQRAGIGHRKLRDLRDSFASHLLSAGVPLVLVSKQLGHESQVLTEIHYAKRLPDGVQAEGRNAA